MRAALVSSLLLLACAGAAPPPTEYLLRGDAPEAPGAVEVPARLAVGRVQVAPYLRRAGIVVEIAPGRLRAAAGHQWAEPLEDGLRALLRAALSRELGFQVGATPGGRVPAAQTIDVVVERLHGTLDGTALLEATYRVTTPAGERVEMRFFATEPLASEGYPGLVAAESALVQRLAEAIAASIRQQTGRP